MLLLAYINRYSSFGEQFEMLNRSHIDIYIVHIAVLLPGNISKEIQSVRQKVCLKMFVIILSKSKKENRKTA